MTIDEAIKFCDEKAKNIKLKAEPQTFIDIAEWLEELKVYKDSERLHKRGFEGGYTQAIDDYMNALCNQCLDMKNECCQLECPFCTDGCDIVNIAEQLKAGG